MKHAEIVIGSNFGDECKGAVVHYISSYHISHGNRVCVVRFNGGCQAGHTTFHQNMRRVWHQFGSATDLGASTYFGPKMIVNPFVFWHEFDDKQLKDAALANIYVDQQCKVSLYCDQIVNQLLEKSRGSNRHGSCGAGINETIERGLNGYEITFGDIATSYFSKKVESVYLEYYPNRVKSLGLNPDDYFAEVSEWLIGQNITDCKKMNERVSTVCGISSIADQFDTFVFEGAQGLRLSENNMDDFPYLTRSDPGIINVLDILTDLGVNQYPDIVVVNYLTRPYITRHGDGPLPHEVETNQFDWVEDKTNKPNDWQGSLRFGYLDLESLKHHINKDLERIPDTFPIPTMANLVVTCWDQVKDRSINFIEKGMPKSVREYEFKQVIQNEFNLHTVIFFEAKGHTNGV